MSATTELVEIKTQLGNIDLEKRVATITLLTRYRVLRTVTNTKITGTVSIISRYVTAIHRTYTLRYGNIYTEIVSIIPTRFLETVLTVTQGAGQQQAAGSGGTSGSGVGILVPA